MRGGEDTDVALLSGTGLKGPWLSKWKKRTDPPRDRPTVQALMRYFEGVVTEAWLIDGVGDPARPDLWAEWFARKRRPAPPATTAELVARTGYAAPPDIRKTTPPTAKRAAGGGKKRRS